MTWRNCVASIILANEVNTRWPNRDKASDGTIGDASHQQRTSDHNPWVIDSNGVGVVRARDIDEDLDGNAADSGWDVKPLFDFLLAKAKAGDHRLINGGYLISEGHIYSERENWAARPYSGTPNPHNHHMHVSFSREASGYDSAEPWGLLLPEHKPVVIKLGDHGNQVAFVADLGNILAHAGYAVNSKGDVTKGQLWVPKDRASREKFFYDHKVRERVAENQRFFVVMWELSNPATRGPKPKVDGIAGEDTLKRYSFWAPIALQKH